MFIQCRKHNVPCLVRLDAIQVIIPMDDGAACSIRADGHDYMWDFPFEQAQEVLIDCAAQVTAPIASRLMGIDNTINRLARSAEDLLEKFNTPIIGPFSQEEDTHIKDMLEGACRTLGTINFSGPASPPILGDVLADVKAVCQLLEDREWAEHCTKSGPGKRLEAEITRLIGHDNAAMNKLQRAEQLLAEIYHAVNNDGGLYPIGPDSDLVARLSEHLYPDPVAALDRIVSQTARDILDE